jgi:hypothetical protein
MRRMSSSTDEVCYPVWTLRCSMIALMCRWITCSMFVASLLAGCTSAHLEAGRDTLARGNLPVAIELLDRGVGAEPKDTELRDAAILTRQNHARGLRQDIDRLVRSKRYLMAVGRLLVLEDLARRAQALNMPGEQTPDLERERRAVVTEAVTQLGRKLDERSGRGLALKADLEACRQLLALLEDDRAVTRACDRLRTRFKLVATLELVAGSAPGAQTVLAELPKLVRARNPELLELLDSDGDGRNARLSLWVGSSQQGQTGWVEVKREALHRWVPKLNQKGRQVEQTVIVQPSQKAIKQAAKQGRPRPKPKRVRRKVFEPVSGEVRVQRATRWVRVPFALTIEAQRTASLVVAIQGMAEARSVSAYYELDGDPRSLKKPPTKIRGRENAPALATHRALNESALAKIPGLLVDPMLERIE